MNLGDSSDGLKTLSLQRGSVFKMKLYPSEGVTPKHNSEQHRIKYFVVLGIDDESVLAGVVLINSDVNVNLARQIEPYQRCVYAKDYNFLSKEYSFVDCYQIKEISYDRIIDEAEYIGIINEDDMKEIIKLANDSPVNKPITLMKYKILLKK